MHETQFSLEYPSAARAAMIERSLQQEAGEISGDRTEAQVDRDGTAITIALAADDLVALRAGHNTWLGLAEVAENTIAAADERP